MVPHHVNAAIDDVNKLELDSGGVGGEGGSSSNVPENLLGVGAKFLN